VTNNTIIKAKNTNKIVSKNLTDCRKAALQMVIFGIFQASLIFMIDPNNLFLNIKKSMRNVV
jgi:hypothetical protein